MCGKIILYVVIFDALIFNKYKEMVNELNIYSYIPQMDVPWSWFAELKL